jgi:predicted ATPase
MFLECIRSCAGFAAYAFLLANAFRDISNGYRAGEIALAILERFKAKEWMARVHSFFYGMCNTWLQPLRESLKPLLVAHRVGLSTGDIEVSHKR